jgi:hypothetical protein
LGAAFALGFTATFGAADDTSPEFTVGCAGAGCAATIRFCTTGFAAAGADRRASGPQMCQPRIDEIDSAAPAVMTTTATNSNGAYHFRAAIRRSS